MGQIRRDLPNDEYQAAVGANNPSASNVFATINDLTSADIPHAVASGTNTYTVTIPGVTSYTDGDAYLIRFTNGNDADSTININGLGVKTLTKQVGVQVSGGDILSGQEIVLVYDGTNFQCIGVSPNQLFAFVTNAEAITITKGQPVYAFSGTGNRMSVKLAFNTSDATSAQTIGLVYSSSIAANQTGFIIIQGVISNVNTGAYAPGDQLYLGATAGTLTNVKPYAPNHLVYLGIVERANAGNGLIYVRTQNGYELDELHDVDLITTPPTDGQVLTYDLTSDLWKARNISIVVGGTVSLSGIDNCIYFQEAGVVQQTSQFQWVNATKTLTLSSTDGLSEITTLTSINATWSTQFVQSYRRANGTKASPLNLTSGDLIARTNYQSFTSGSSYIPSARIDVVVEANHTATSIPARLAFFTTPTGSTTTLERMRINQAGLVGIGGAQDPGARLDVRAQGTATTDISFRVRNFANTQDIIRAFHNSNGDGDVFIGQGAGNVTTGVENTFIGISAGLTNTTGFRNIGVGAFSLFSNTQGTLNTAVGYLALGNINNIGGNNIAVGASAGTLITSAANNTSATNSVFLGAGTRANNVGETNQIVIGNDARGLGSNSVVLGNSSVTVTQLRGNVISGNQAGLSSSATDGFLYIPTCGGVPTGTPTSYTGKAALVADTTNNRLYVYLSGAWRLIGP